MDGSCDFPLLQPADLRPRLAARIAAKWAPQNGDCYQFPPLELVAVPALLPEQLEGPLHR